MESYNIGLAVQKLLTSKFSFFTTSTLLSNLDLPPVRNSFLLIGKLVKNGILTKLEKNAYILTASPPQTFVLANLLYRPSYISFETALNYHGILSQFPYEITSATPKKTALKKIQGQAFSYSHIKTSLFWGYEKTPDGSLLALPEKALLDQAYLSLKGIKNLNLEEYDISRINRHTLKEFTQKYPCLPKL